MRHEHPLQPPTPRLHHPQANAGWIGPAEPDRPTSASPARSAASAPPPVTAPGTWAFLRENSATCNSASAPSSSHLTEFAHGHGMRRCRYRGQPKAHLQHVFTAIAVNIERRSGLPSSGETNPPRPSTAFQDFLDQHEIPRLKSWRAVSS
ncbi:transposase [Actinophytocola sp.]|uniref:transposase n=1 Tax=Actinophytocola sp. TaxID=1872138 RepID=UPI003899803B